MGNPVRLAVVGLGSIGRRHSRLLLERSDVKIEVVEQDAAALGAARDELGDLVSHDSFDAMLKTNPDIVWIATPTSMHADQAIAALQSGSHVFCEKPMSDRLGAAWRMKLAADEASQIMNIGYHLHFWPGFLALKRTIASGELGQILHAHVRVGTYITLVNSRSRYQAHREGSLVWDYSHQPDMLYWLLESAPESVYTVAMQAGEIQLSSNPNVAIITCKHKQDLLSTIHLNYVQAPERHEWEIVGDKGWALLDFNEGALRRGSALDQPIQIKNFGTDRDDIYRAEQQAFLDAVAGKRPPETSAQDGLVSTQACQAAIESWRTGKWIRLDELGTE